MVISLKFRNFSQNISGFFLKVFITSSLHLVQSILNTGLCEVDRNDGQCQV